MLYLYFYHKITINQLECKINSPNFNTKDDENSLNMFISNSLTIF